MNPPLSPACAGKSILIVEDSLTQSLRLQLLLERYGFRVIAARDGEEALKVLDLADPDLVLSDIQMPGIDGYELCRLIKQRGPYAELPVMLLTSLSAPEDIIHGLECGADNFVVKPYGEEFLLRRIDSVLSNRLLQRNLAEQSAITVEFAGHQYSIDSTRRQILNLLLSTYETAVQTNRDLIRTHEQLKAAQNQLIQAEKLLTIGRLAAGVAHEVRNPLAIMEMGLTFLDSLGLPPEAMAMIGEIHEALRRADRVIASLMESSSPREMGMREVDLAQVLRHSLLGFASEFTSSRIVLKSDLAAELPAVTIDEARMEQVFQNLFANAVQAMPGGGTLTIRTALQALATGDFNFKAGDRSGVNLREGGKVAVIEISDTGGGIAPEHLELVFDPFFSTKPTGKGVGLGLTVARKIVELHGGHIDVINGPDGGATVRILLKLP